MSSSPEHEIALLHEMYELLDRYIESRETTEPAERHYSRSRADSELYRALFRNLPSDVFILNEDGRIRLSNPHLRHSLGYRPADLQGRSIYDLVHPDDTPVIREKFSQLMAGAFGSFHFTQIRLRNNDGGWRVFDGEVQNLMSDRDVEGILFTAREVTERNQVNQALLQSQKMESLGFIASGIAHDFRNIMAVILGAAEILLMDPDQEEFEKFMDMIISSVHRGNAITERILEFAQAGEPNFQVLSASDHLRRIEQIAAHSLPKDISIHLKPSESDDRIFGDPGQLEQVLLNLCINSADAMPEGGEITLTVEDPAPELVRKHSPSPEIGYLCFRVSDSGIGMDQQTQERMFEPFFTTKEGGDGTGLGLATVYSIVQQHNGWIDVESRKGEGTTIRVGIPRADHGVDGNSGQPHPEHKEESQKRDDTILLAEDEPELQTLITHLLSHKGFTVLSAKNGREAADLYDRHRESIALILTDLKMPVMSGWELERYIHDQDPSVKMIAITGSLGVGEEKLKSREAFDRVVEKPFDVLDLLQTVRAVLKADSDRKR